jgi:hypothetical protein
LKDAGIEVRQAPGLRVAVLICDDDAWVFNPTALYVEEEVHSEETPNAVQISPAEATRILERISPNRFADQSSPESENGPEIGIEEVSEEALQDTEVSLEQNPPVPFDVSRQVRVFQAYIQYVEIKLLGAAIQRQKIQIPGSIVNLGEDTRKMEDRLKTTFDLLAKDSTISSKRLEDQLQKIREDFTPSLGRPWGRVLLRSSRPKFELAIEALRGVLAAHAEQVKDAIATEITRSLDSIVTYYLPWVLENPPRNLRAQIRGPKPQEEEARRWLENELRGTMKSPDDLVKGMTLEVLFRDVTYETLNEAGFAEALAKAFPVVDWDKPFSEFDAARERS